MNDSRVGWTGGLTTAAACLVLVVIGVGSGPAVLLGALVGSVAVLLLRVRLTATYAFAAGQTTLVATLNDPIPVGPTLFAEAVLFGLLFEPGLRSAQRRRGVLAAAVFGLVLGGVAWGGLEAWDRLWAASLVLLGTGGLIGYLLHRYEYVQRGVITGE